MLKTLSAQIIGVAAFIMHNGQLADPLNPISKALKAVTTKQGKTDADFAEAAKIEFLGSLYMDKDGPIIPGQLIDAAIIEGAKKAKLGKLAKAGVFAENARLEYDGPREADVLRQDTRFVLAVPVGNKGKKVVRTRPIFREWSAKIEARFDEQVINEQDLLRAIRAAGLYCGIGDWRPRNGRFSLADDIAATTKTAA